MLNVAFTSGVAPPAPAIPTSSSTASFTTKGRTASGTSVAAASTTSSTAASSSAESLSQHTARNSSHMLLPPLSPIRRRAATTTTMEKRERDESQLTKSELFDLRQRQLRDKREEVTWETSSYDRERGRMVRSLNVVERNRLLDTQRQLRREMEQRMRDIRQEQTAVLTVYTASKGMVRALSHQDLRLLLMSTGNSRSHSGGTSRFC